MGKLKKKETCWEDVLRDTWEKMKEREREKGKHWQLLANPQLS